MHTPTTDEPPARQFAARVPDVRRVPLDRQSDPARAVVLRRVMRAAVAVTAGGFQSSI